MADDRLFDGFGALDRPTQPDAAFAEGLFEDLATDLGFRPVTHRASLMRRFAYAPPAFRLAYLAAMLGLLLAAGIVAALVGAQLSTTRSVMDIVAASQATQLDPPAYDITILADDGRITRVRTDGLGAWRRDWISDREMPPGTYEIHAAGQSGRFDPSHNTWIVSADESDFIDASVLMWQSPNQQIDDPVAVERGPGAAQPAAWFTCDSWVRLADDVIAGRSAHHLACDGREFWVDEESSLLVGMLTPVGQELAGVSGRATALALEPSFPPETYALATPAGAVAIDPNHLPASLVLEIGRSAPRLRGTTLDGKPFDSATESGPLVVYFWAPWCEPCVGSYLTDLQAVAERHAAAVSTVTIAPSAEPGAVTEYVATNGVRLPVVSDNDSGSLAESWGLVGIPVLVMLDPDGAVVALRAATVSGPELEQMYAALAAGEPVPTPVATPAPTIEP